MEDSLSIVAVHDLKVGMFVAEPDCPWTQLSFPLQGFVISDPKEIEEFARHCRFVHVDSSFSTGEHHRPPVRERDKPLQCAAFEKEAMSAEIKKRQERRKRFLQFLYDQDKSPHAKAFAEELAYIEPHFDNVQVSLRQTLENLRVEEKVDFRNVSEKIGELSGSLERNPDAVMWLLRLKRADIHSFDQAMDVSIYLLLLGKHVGLAGEQLIQLSMAGMLQDVGKTSLPPELLAKSGELSDKEKSLVRSHVASSLELLCLQHSLPPEMLMIVANHHERWDGSGYPRGLKTRAIGREAEMAGLVDSFCSMLKTKPYRAAKGHQEALEELYKLRDQHFNPALMEQLVQCVGLYPIGTLLELNNGEVGVVIEQNRVQRSRPRLLMLLDAQKRKTRDYHIIDLREPRYKAHVVLRSLPQDAYGLAAQDYYLG
jgi:HD-GYP domain-containing protein (c-di-GMP phosphodiesterase class II)